MLDGYARLNTSWNLICSVPKIMSDVKRTNLVLTDAEGSAIVTHPSGEAIVCGHGPHQHHLDNDNSSIGGESPKYVIFH